MGALSLSLGNRADTDVLFDKSRKCIVEAAFNIRNLQLQPWFNQFDLDYQDDTLIRREINEHGKSRAFINDTPVNLVTMKTIASFLVDIHSQHQTLMLQNASFRLQLIDQFAQNQELVKTYQQMLRQWRTKKSELETLKHKCEEAALKYDYNTFTIGELEKAAIQPGEQATIEQRIKELTNAESIKSHLYNAAMLLSEQEGDNIVYMLKTVQNECRALENLGGDYETFRQRVDNLLAETQDLSYEISKKSDQIEINPELLEQLNERIDLLFSLQNKHHVRDNEELLTLLESLRNEVETYSDDRGQLTEMEKETSRLEATVRDLAQKVTASRKEAIPALVSAMEERLRKLGMSGSLFRVDLQETDELRENGSDLATFLFSANAGIAPADMSKIASGGEMSRIMLAFKKIIGDYDHIPTMIFDEIDSGISGIAASVVGRKLCEIAKRHQIICITHLPQIAAFGTSNYRIWKHSDEAMTYTSVDPLSPEEKIREIARLLGGENITPTTLASAQELIEASK
jgi:DNA repair protein RecN (Recombination protein N)